MALQSERKDDAIPQPEWATPAFTKIGKENSETKPILRDRDMGS